MVRILVEQRLEDRGRAKLGRVALVGRQRGLIHRERMKDLGLDVVRMTAHEVVHRALVGEDAIALRKSAVALEQCGHRVDVAAFALARRAGRAARLDRGEPLREGRVGAHPAERVAPVRERDAPVGDGARVVGREHPLEAVDRRAELEGVEQRHGSVDLGGDRRSTRVLEPHTAELLRKRCGFVTFVLLRAAERRGGERDPKNEEHRCADHRRVLLHRCCDTCGSEGAPKPRVSGVRSILALSGDERDECGEPQARVLDVSGIVCLATRKTRSGQAGGQGEIRIHV